MVEGARTSPKGRDWLGVQYAMSGGEGPRCLECGGQGESYGSGWNATQKHKSAGGRERLQILRRPTTHHIARPTHRPNMCSALRDEPPANLSRNLKDETRTRARTSKTPTCSRDRNGKCNSVRNPKVRKSNRDRWLSTPTVNLVCVAFRFIAVMSDFSMLPHSTRKVRETWISGPALEWCIASAQCVTGCSALNNCPNLSYHDNFQ